jgi:hypothetical protein
VCFCSAGFYESETGDCVDVDECEEDNGGCEEECHNKPGSYICKLKHFTANTFKHSTLSTIFLLRAVSVHVIS